MTAKQTGKPLTEEHKAKLRKPHGPLSLETRKRMSEAHKRRYKTQFNANKGRTLPKEWCHNISEGLKRYYSEHKIWNKGIEHSEATKHKISVSCKENGVGRWNKGRERSKPPPHKRPGKEDDGSTFDHKPY